MVEQYLRAVRSLIDSLGVSEDDAMDMARVPAELRKQVHARYEEETTLPIRQAKILSGSGGPRSWFNDWDTRDGYYWPGQRAYLIDRLGWKHADIGSLDETTDKILAHLEDPRESGPAEFDVRGLVMGYVQSGKTANFCAMAAKAADVGYKLVIVLSGIHNSLRLQTQRRLDRALGLDPRGVSEPDPGWRWISLTSPDLYGDFRIGTADAHANVLQGNDQVLIVCKKNSTVLRRLIGWMENRAPASLPVLIIDDEADQASINTRGNRQQVQEEVDLLTEDLGDASPEDELDPSVINGHIRRLIASFSRVSYIAYTATPFANVLINHLAIDREVFQDLYPRDFIISLPRPYGYCGAERLFGRDALPGEQDGKPGLDVIDLVPDYEAELLTPRGAEDVESYDPVICPSLRTAFLDFVLAIAARAQRSGDDLPATMLIHTHHRRLVQNRLGERLRGFVSEVRQTWRWDPESIKPELKAHWNKRFRPVTVSVDVNRDVRFEAIEGHLDRFFRDPILVLVLNSDSADQLDYDADPHLKVVVVGGNRLSRGLTLEGLLVSYYVRRAEYYDTLMQMGRWFGFREDYIDLTRIWTTDELAGWFRDLALAEEELRHEIERYERENLTPLDFGPRIRRHPAMMITARNKMPNVRVIEQNYSGCLLQTTAFRLDEREWLEANLDAGRALITQLGPSDTSISMSPSQPVWANIPWQVIDDFLSGYRFDPRGVNEMEAIRTYIQAQVLHDELIEWHVSVQGRGTYVEQLGAEPLFSIDGIGINRIARTRLKSVPYSIGSLVNPATRGKPIRSGDEEIGLTDEQLTRAREEADQYDSFPEALRVQRSPRHGLMLLYPISPYSQPGKNDVIRIPLFDNPDRDGCTVLGIALSFPFSESAATIEYVVGSVRPMEGEE